MSVPRIFFLREFSRLDNEVISYSLSPYFPISQTKTSKFCTHRTRVELIFLLSLSVKSIDDAPQLLLVETHSVR